MQLSRRSIYGSGETFDAITSQVEMQYGETRSGFLAGPLRQFDMQWEDLNASERDELYKLHASSYFGAKPLLWIPSYEATTTAASAAEQEVLYGKLQAPRFQFTEKDFGLYQPAGFSVRSLGREAGA
ncbi:MAG: hypothetical protein IPJ65_07255 [Archangiaceae bacterium]|nr:hypothetical protein [Archangiaceae bacterium]